MSKLTSLLLFLAAFAGSSGNSAPGACRPVAVKKTTDCCLKPACCPPAGPGACCQVIVRKTADCCLQPACCPATTPDARRQAIVRIVGDSETLAAPRAVAMLCLADENDLKAGPRAVGDAPKVWIGVRVSPVPEPLAAHLKRRGLMIANVAKDSPADRAALQRYDVIVSFAGQPIEDMDDLLEAVGSTGADNPAELLVIRHGKQKSLTITPVERGDMDSLSFKYDEPEAPVDLFKDYFGHRFRLGPRGRAFVWPQGRMKLPDDVKELLEDIPDIDWDEWFSKLPQIKCQPFGFRMDLDEDDSDSWPWCLDEDDDADVKVELRIRVEEDGESITIERGQDGIITVEREDAEGERSSATYENVDQLCEEDPQAYKTCRRLLRLRGPRMLFISPDLKDLGARQRQFEIELKRQLRKAREQVDRATDQLRKTPGRFELRLRSGQPDQDEDTTRPQTVMIFVDDDGHIILEIEEDGVSRKYEFDSREDFSSAEPELYQRFKKHLDSAP